MEKKQYKVDYTNTDSLREPPISVQLREQGKINESFEVMLSALSMEELMALKLESIVRTMRGKYFGFPLWKVFPKIIKDALLKIAVSMTTNHKDAALLLGMTAQQYYFQIMTHDVLHKQIKKSMADYVRIERLNCMTDKQYQKLQERIKKRLISRQQQNIFLHKKKAERLAYVRNHLLKGKENVRTEDSSDSGNEEVQS